MAQKYQGKPIFFIAVNSGTLRPEIEQYAREVGAFLPIVIDPTRDYERKCSVGEISLQNISQVKIITADGQMRGGYFPKIEESIAKPWPARKWWVDPATIPDPLIGAWQAIEFGNFMLGLRRSRRP